MDGWMNQAYSRLSTTYGHITDCKLLVCMYWARLVLVRPAASLYSAGREVESGSTKVTYDSVKYSVNGWLGCGCGVNRRIEVLWYCCLVDWC